MPGRRATALILLLALALRVGVVIGTPGFAPSGDPADYETHAIALVEFGAYPPTALAEPYTPSAYRQPAYPLLLAGAYTLPGDDRTAGRLLGALLGTLSVGLVMLLAGRIFGPRTAVWAGVVAALDGLLVWLNASLLSESLFVPLVLGVLLCLERHVRRPSPGTAALAGALAGAAILTRSTGIVLLVPLAGALLVGRRDWRALGAAAVAVALVLAPWTIRNAATFDRLLPLGTQGGYTAAGQWNEVAAAPGELQAAWRLGQEVPSLQDVFRRPGIDEAELDAALRRRALTFARHHPRHVATAFSLNSLRQLDVGPGHAFATRVALGEMGVPERQRAGLRLSAYAALLLALAGCAVLLWPGRRAPRGPWWLWLTPVVLFLSVAPLSGSPRYRAAVEPFVAIAAAVAIVRLADYRHRPTTRSRHRLA